MQDYPQTSLQKSKTVRGGLFQRELQREFMATGAPVFAVLVSLVVLSQLIRLLTESVSGSLPVDGVLVMLGFSALNYLPVLLSVSMFLAVLLTLTRCYRDSEMVTWFSSGLGLTQWIRPVLGFALPVVALIGLMSLVFSPWALSQADEYKRRLDSRDDVAAAQPGMFRESKQADRVYFLEDVDVHKKRIGNIFVQSNQNGINSVMMAKEGYQETASNGDRFLVLLNGTRYEGVPGQSDFRMVEFARYAVRIEAVETKLPFVNPKALSTLALVEQPTSWHLSELEWRLGLPISALILAVMAIPLSFVNPRAGRSLNLIMAIMIYMLYNNMISVTNAWVGQGKLGPIAGLSLLHLAMLLLVAMLFYRRMAVFSWRRLAR
ncbi:Lipopolysaccharide export system permease protein LptF [Ferriphaselus amnicola]|uniref:Lipopolysaccharide export system permease protein LptF n=1 Tax=Ferriphaselus amnicola TaxID=1188319 RepID=A0A2Z6GDB9_9PROT|nr:LPS export ABC transporter permease LptF [Ferriphaselus amnicola]BBE51611.1 Lipopolysaccharide export system permease protein LptF [Ferriphaselus amnicola]